MDSSGARRGGWSSRSPLTARRLRIAMPALAGILLATALVAALMLGDTGKGSFPVTLGDFDVGPDVPFPSPIAVLADPGSRNVNLVVFSPGNTRGACCRSPLLWPR
jgi:hypothetical protein